MSLYVHWHKYFCQEFEVLWHWSTIIDHRQKPKVLNTIGPRNSGNEYLLMCNTHLVTLTLVIVTWGLKNKHLVTVNACVSTPMWSDLMCVLIQWINWQSTSNKHCACDSGVCVYIWILCEMWNALKGIILVYIAYVKSVVGD